MKNHDNWELKPGSVVLIEVHDKKRMDWPLGVITEVYPGRDGKVRTAHIKTKDGSYLRPAQRLYLLEVPDNPEEKQEVDQVPEPNPDPVEVSESSVPPKAEVKVTRSGRKVYQPDRFTN
ncbi:hypothetical protein Ocin01_18798 [Orchesella cincta]|uniref:DUF5641 domain-containing protein n=1 Tax=Orchesella cincta TaxID=48709 RepID=A0A1D2M4N0_ORCCI|nr:hypothetical protein Ocin01_18798 [Orchesella cincta]